MRTALLLHSNLLSCSVPSCGNAYVRRSIVAIGNRLGHAKGEYPAWVSKYEQDPLFWVSGFEGMSLFVKISGAAGFFMLTMFWKLKKARWPRLMSEWLSGPAVHIWFAQASSHLGSCLVKESLLAAVFLVFLLFWDLYACPETLAMASSCLRSSALVRALGVLLLVPTLLSFSCNGALDNGRQESYAGRQASGAAMDCEEVEKEVMFVVAVVCADSGALICLYPLSGDQVHPGLSSTWTHLVVRAESLRWDHSRDCEQVCRAVSCQPSDSGEACLHTKLQLDHELSDSCCRHHVP